jgi:hypothetical protein
MKTDSHLDSSERTERLDEIQQAMKQAVREALIRHKQAGNPVATWRDGRVVWIPPEEIPVEESTPSATL